MLVLIVVVVVLGATAVLGTLVGRSVADNHAGDRLRRRAREARLAGVRAGTASAGDLPTRAVLTRDVLARSVVEH